MDGWSRENMREIDEMIFNLKFWNVLFFCKIVSSLQLCFYFRGKRQIRNFINLQEISIMFSSLCQLLLNLINHLKSSSFIQNKKRQISNPHPNPIPHHNHNPFSPEIQTNRQNSISISPRGGWPGPKGFTEHFVCHHVSPRIDQPVIGGRITSTRNLHGTSSLSPSTSSTSDRKLDSSGGIWQPLVVKSCYRSVLNLFKKELP